MANINFDVLRSICIHSDLFIKRKRDKTSESIYYCDNTDRSESRGCRYCEEEKCPLIEK